MGEPSMIVTLAGGITAQVLDQTIDAVVVAVLVAGAVAYGLRLNRDLHRGPWRAAWQALGCGLVGITAGQLFQALHVGGPPTQVGVPMILSTGGDLLAIMGLISLIHQRLPERSADSLAEALLSTLALGFVILALVVVPSQGWRPGFQLPAIAAPLLDMILLWLVCCLVSLTERNPALYRYLLCGFLCLFVANSSYAALALGGRGHSSHLVATVALAGALFWGVGFVHRSRKVAFDPVPLRSVRPRGVRVAMLVAVGLVVPAVLSAESVLGIRDHQPALMIGSTLLPSLLVLYLLHQVFTHAAAEYRAQHDSLTGVCNRLLFEDRLQRALVQADRSNSAVSVMFLDLDRFKDINDSLGHAVGNELLKAVVKRLQGCLREHDTLARFGGDEFTFLIPDSGRKDGLVVDFAERLLDRFEDPFSVGGRQLTVKASIGVAVSPWDGADADTLLKHADTAMYQAKAAGRNTYQVFDSGMSARARLRFALEDSLRGAVDSGRLAVHYQPKLDMASGDIVGVEALARWRHPSLGFIPPWAFIPLAEETSLVATLGEWVLDVACRQAQGWQEQGLPAIPVAVNLSPRQFAHQPVVEMVTSVLKRTGLDPTLLELEVTESVLMERVDEVVASLNELRALGVRCSIDDFGTGYSALTYLAEMPIDAIKIDRSFIQRIDGEASGASIVGAVIALAHSLDLVVVAEGVESDEQLQFLDAHGCDQVQGFRFSPPLPAAEIVELMRTPAGVFTEWATEPVAVPLPISGISPARLEALLESIMSDRHSPSELDSEAIEAVLTALQADELTKVKSVRPGRARSAKVAVSTLASLATMSGGAAAAGALTIPAESLGARILDEGSVTAVAASAVTEATQTDAGAAPSEHGSGDPVADGQVSAS
ncbi:MAG TPA: EAL domain-containing protein [Acidimicrobiales bacterium]|nr:EAL domain-containing protein [Acidimicrobiales bacterium]